MRNKQANRYRYNSLKKYNTLIINTLYFINAVVKPVAKALTNPLTKSLKKNSNVRDLQQST